MKVTATPYNGTSELSKSSNGNPHFGEQVQIGKDYYNDYSTIL